MSVNLITGYAGKAHITAEGDGAVNAGMYGDGKYVLDVSEKFACEIISNNLIRVKSGYAINQGRKIELAVNDYEEMEIDNGLHGVKRCDLIVIHYSKDMTTGVETATMEVIKGTSGDDYADPSYTSGNIINGASEDDFLLYRVKINGLNIEGVEPLFVITNSIQEQIDRLNSDLTVLNTNLIHAKRTSDVWWSPTITVLSAWLLVDDVNKTAELCADVTFTPTSAGKLDMCSIPSDIVPITPTNGHGYPIINTARGTIIIGTLIGRVLSVNIPQSYVNVYQSLSISIRFMYSN